MPNNYEGQEDMNDHGGYGIMHGKIASPQGPCGYNVTPNGGASKKGGEPMGPFGSHKETPNEMMGVARDSLGGAPQQGFGNVGSGGGISTPMDTSTAMPGVTGESSGTGPTSGGGAKISSPFVSPWGDMVG